MKRKNGVAVHGDDQYAALILQVSTDAADMTELFPKPYEAEKPKFPQPPEGVFAHSSPPYSGLTSADMIGLLRQNSAFWRYASGQPYLPTGYFFSDSGEHSHAQHKKHSSFDVSGQ